MDPKRSISDRLANPFIVNFVWRSHDNISGPLDYDIRGRSVAANERELDVLRTHFHGRNNSA